MTTSITRAIEMAINEGWKGLRYDEDGITVDTLSQIAWGRTASGLGRHLPLAVIFLDTLFWQALGKARGWKSWFDDEGFQGSQSDGPMFHIPEWLYEWHRFIDHLAAGKDAESFFEELLK